MLVGDSLDLASEGRWCRLADVCEREERSSTVVAGAGAAPGAGLPVQEQVLVRVLRRDDVVAFC